MRIFEVEGPSVEEVIALFSRQQGISRDYIEHEVIESGSKGMLGFGKRNAKVKIMYNEVEHKKRRARVILSEMLEKAGFPDTHVDMEQKGERIVLNIHTTSERDLLVGKSGQTIDAMQYLVEKMLDIDNTSKMEVIVDVDGYKEKAIDDNIEKALKLAEQVKTTGKPAKLPAMPASMRKSVHIALRSVPEVTTISTGVGALKQINIIPEKKGK